MPIRLIAPLVLSSLLAVFGQGQLKPVTYYPGLEQEPIRGRTIGIIDGDPIKVLIVEKQQIRVRLAFVDAPETGQAGHERTGVRQGS
jgi:endonuclease YncB( thermonuclease family)